MWRFVKKWGTITLVIVGAWTVAQHLGLIALLSDKTAVVELGQNAPEIGRKIVEGAKDGITGTKRYDDVERLKNVTEHLRQQLAAEGDLQKVWEQSHTWEQGQVNSSKAPILEVELQGASPMIKAVIRTTDGEKAVDIAGLPEDAEIAYWDLKTPIRVNRNFGEHGQPVMLYPAAQRTKDGLSFVQGWIYAEDLAQQSTTKTSQGWTKVETLEQIEWWIELTPGQQSPEVLLTAPKNGDVGYDITSNNYQELLWSVNGEQWQKPSDGLSHLSFPAKVKFQTPPWAGPEVVRVKTYNKEVTQ